MQPRRKPGPFSFGSELRVRWTPLKMYTDTAPPAALSSCPSAVNDPSNWLAKPRADGASDLALSEIEVARVTRALDSFIQVRRPAPHTHARLDLGYRISRQGVEIFEIRPAWRGLPHDRHESAVAKATMVRSRNVWRAFWQRRDLKWHGYEPAREVKSRRDARALGPATWSPPRPLQRRFGLDRAACDAAGGSFRATRSAGLACARSTFP